MILPSFHNGFMSAGHRVYVGRVRLLIARLAKLIHYQTCHTKTAIFLLVWLLWSLFQC